ncbi:hypothetical protein CLAVI_000147 [Candidatus Clavichlamydia salmonicola]|uniref:NifU family protein n=1 Tax=Candidatus Clavichlamydia salmonicola TaxID=469812 RepID=UPI001890B6F8|nr:iron-sulfur cluster assembly scaffold protein [Candidatus Clavichlamydia salmonicola]MBF5050537.1 hypothetical protein [Candidatus Clavichlamydia salmonicola]
MFYHPHQSWHRYSKKMIRRILSPISPGFFSENESSQRDMRCVIGFQGDKIIGNQIVFYLLVDETDGMIVDARFTVFGHSSLIASADALCELVIGKNYQEASRLSINDIDKHLSDKTSTSAFPFDTQSYLNFSLDALAEALDNCSDLPVRNFSSPFPSMMEEVDERLCNDWPKRSEADKIIMINMVLDNHIRPYVSMDGGDVTVISLNNDEVTIAYGGNCTGCFSAMGSTLSAIQNVLNKFLSPEISVKVDVDNPPSHGTSHNMDLFSY